MNSISRILISTMLVSCASTSFAGSFDFADEANTNGERVLDGSGLNTGANLNGNVFAVGSIYVTVTASNGDPYLDGKFNGLDGGLGVCAITSGTQCDPNDDDNVTSNESVTLSFSSDQAGINSIDVTLTTILFRNTDHGTTFASDAMIDISVDNGITFQSISLTHVFDGSVFGSASSFEFRYNNAEFYLSFVQVPEPTTLALLGLGLLGVSAARRRRKAS